MRHYFTHLSKLDLILIWILPTLQATHLVLQSSCRLSNYMKYNRASHLKEECAPLLSSAALSMNATLTLSLLSLLLVWTLDVSAYCSIVAFWLSLDFSFCSLSPGETSALLKTILAHWDLLLNGMGNYHSSPLNMRINSSLPGLTSSWEAVVFHPHSISAISYPRYSAIFTWYPTLQLKIFQVSLQLHWIYKLHILWVNSSCHSAFIIPLGIRRFLSYNS